MFAGLFVVVAGVEKTPLLGIVACFHIDRMPVLSIFAALLSNLVGNVPAVLIFKPLVPHLADPARAWLHLAMSTTLAGNLTTLGSVANLIVIQQACREVHIGFWEYFRAGAPLTVLTTAAGLLLL